MKIYVGGTHLKRLAEELIMSTRNICFCGEKRKLSLLSIEKCVLPGVTIITLNIEKDRPLQMV